ncbi:C3HC zinc finger-like-domain-containing protein [Coemansia mojavensis]|nr:C3HC zinc finger-like-domain-containing protein [Coemansia mojavensis]
MATSTLHDQTKRRIESALSSFSPKRQRQSSQLHGTSVETSFTKCRPWSLDDLLERISTYKTYTWLVQSSKLSPVCCARNGWINVDCSTLKCPQCSAIIIAQLPDDLTEDEEVRWIERLAQQLQESHEGTCLWKGRACPDNIYSAPLVTSRETVDEVCQHAAHLLEFGETLPAVDHPLTSFQQGLVRDLGPKVLNQYTVDSGHSPGDDEVFSALSLALFGWRPDRSKPQGTIKCEWCFRSAGLWLFQSSVAATSSSDAQQLRLFNPADEHRSFCYWSRGSGAESESIPGWKKTMASILRAKTIESSNFSTASDSNDRDAVSDSNIESTTTDDSSDILKRLKPFNISAISSAAEAFGIPFSMSQLALAVQRLASTPASQTAASPSSLPDTIPLEPTSESSVLLRTAVDEDFGVSAAQPDEWESDGLRTHFSDDDNNCQPSGADDIPEPIDTSGLASLLGDSTLANALEDPAKSKAILEYVKNLLKARNSQAPATTKS